MFCLVPAWLRTRIDLGRSFAILRDGARKATRFHGTGEGDQLGPVRKLFDTVEAGEKLCKSPHRGKSTTTKQESPKMGLI